MADKIRRDERVSVIERTNLRHLATLPQRVDLVTLDLSFISILMVSFQMLTNCLQTFPHHRILQLVYLLLNVVAPSHFSILIIITH